MTIAIGVLYYLYFSGDKVNVTQKTANVCDYVRDVDHFFSHTTFLPNEMTFSNALHIAGANDKMNIVNFLLIQKKKIYNLE
jgi:hypothetical protein